MSRQTSKFSSNQPLWSHRMHPTYGTGPYGASTQYADLYYNSVPLPPEGITVVSKILGYFIYYIVEVDSTIVVALSNLAATQ